MCIRDGAMALARHGEILEVGPSASLRKSHAGVKVTAYDGVITPGFVNAHTHLELSGLKDSEICLRQGFTTWAQSMMRARAELNPGHSAEAIAQAVASLEKAGTVLIGEVTNTLSTVLPLDASNIEGWIFHEVFGFNDEKAEMRIQGAESARQGLERAGWPARLRYGLSPHALFSSSETMLKMIAQTVREAKTLCSLHLAEHVDERLWVEKGAGPLAKPMDPTMSPKIDLLEYASRLGFLQLPTLLVHLAVATRGEIKAVARSGRHVVLCPKSNLNIDGHLPPVGEMLSEGLRPALGTDSIASNDSLDVFQEACELSAAFADVQPRNWLFMLTVWGARSLQFDTLGSLTPGRQARALFWPSDGPAFDEPLRWLLSDKERPRIMIP